MLRDIIKTLEQGLRDQIMKNFDTCEPGLFDLPSGFTLGVHIEDYSSFEVIEKIGVWSLLRRK